MTPSKVFRTNGSRICARSRSEGRDCLSGTVRAGRARRLVDCASDIRGRVEIAPEERYIRLVLRFTQSVKATPSLNTPPSIGDLVRSFLIQIQKTKVDLELAMSALDKLLRSNELNFAMLAVIPTLVVVAFITRQVRSVLSETKGMRKRQTHDMIRNSLRCVIRTSVSVPNRHQLTIFFD